MLDFRVLGPLEVVRDGERVPLVGPRQRALLALLLTQRGTALSAERIVDALWGEAAGGGLHALRVQVSKLRKLVGSTERPGDEVIVTRGPAYALSVRPEEVDAERFERLLAEAR